MLKAVIFDFDGVIVDTEPLHYRAFQEILIPIGLGYSWDDYLQKYIGFDDRDAFREAFKASGRCLSETELMSLIAEKAAAFNRVIGSGVKSYPGVVELISSLKGRIPLALCSGALTSDIDPILDQLRLYDAFDVRITADDVVSSKPDPESYLLAVEKLATVFPGIGVTGATCLAIEDTPAGIASAAGAGIKVLAVTNSYQREMLAGACKVVDTLLGIDLDSLSFLV